MRLVQRTRPSSLRYHVVGEKGAEGQLQATTRFRYDFSAAKPRAEISALRTFSRLPEPLDDTEMW